MRLSNTIKHKLCMTKQCTKYKIRIFWNPKW